MYKILFVAGTWDENLDSNGSYGKASGLARKISDAIREYTDNNTRIDIYNGGRYQELQNILQKTPDYDYVFWFANVDNSLPKIRNVKEIAPYTMLITSKRNDNDKYRFMELTQRTLAAKANLSFEFKKNENGLFNIMVYDPLGCVWFNGTDVCEAVKSALARLAYLKSITRQSTIQSDTNKGLVLSWYFDRFKQPEFKSDKNITVREEQEFIELVRKYAEDFHKIMNPGCNIKRFLGNASLKPFPPQVGRCSKGMPSFKQGDFVFVSQRNVDKEFIELDNFVPVYFENEKLYYCGDEKPSVDTPIQLRLYEKLPNIKYMIHSHCYIEGAPFTSTSIPCGAIEEVDEIIAAIKDNYNSNTLSSYRLNLKGHGSILMGKTISDLKNVKYIGRPLPEDMSGSNKIYCRQYSTKDIGLHKPDISLYLSLSHEQHEELRCQLQQNGYHVIWNTKDEMKVSKEDLECIKSILDSKGIVYQESKPFPIYL